MSGGRGGKAAIVNHFGGLLVCVNMWVCYKF